MQFWFSIVSWLESIYGRCFWLDTWYRPHSVLWHWSFIGSHHWIRFVFNTDFHWKFTQRLLYLGRARVVVIFLLGNSLVSKATGEKNQEWYFKVHLNIAPANRRIVFGEFWKPRTGPEHPVETNVSLFIECFRMAMLVSFNKGHLFVSNQELMTRSMQPLY